MTRVALAWPLIAMGIALLLDAHLGVAPFDVLNTAVSEALDVPFSIVYPAVSVLFFAMGVALGGRIGWASVAGTLVIGPLIGVFRDLVPEPERLVPRCAMVIVATLILAAAVCIVITTELGAGPTEVFMLGLVHRGVPLVIARWFTDGFPLVLGTVLGGAAGVGTVVFGLALGPLIKVGLATMGYETKPDEQRTPVTATS